MMSRGRGLFNCALSKGFWRLICPRLEFLAEPRSLRTHPGARRYGSPPGLGSAPASWRPRGRGRGSRLSESAARGRVGAEGGRAAVPRPRAASKDYPAPGRLPPNQYSPNQPGP